MLLLPRCVVLRYNEKSGGGVHGLLHPLAITGELVSSLSDLAPPSHSESCPGEETGFGQFITKGYVSISRDGEQKVPVTILRDTGAHQSFMLGSLLSLPVESSCQSDVLVWGIEMRVIRVPLHMVYLEFTWRGSRLF